jgi:hypothetical protein
MWKVSGISASSGAFNYNMTLTQADDGTVTGVVKSMGMKITGKYNGQSFTFSQVNKIDAPNKNKRCALLQDMGGKVNTCSAERTDAKVMQGTYTSSSGGSGNFSCMKKK